MPRTKRAPQWEKRDEAEWSPEMRAALSEARGEAVVPDAPVSVDDDHSDDGSKPLTTAQFARVNKGGLRAEAALLFVDMEEGIFKDEHGQPWAGAPSKMVICRALGFAGSGAYMPAFVREPEFGRAVEYERIRRLATGSGRMTKDEIAVLASVSARAALLEATRRFVLEPEKIGDRELFPEARNFARLAAEVGDPTGSGETKGVSNTINVFFAAADRLPPRAREKFLGIFDDSMRRLALVAGDARAKVKP